MGLGGAFIDRRVRSRNRAQPRNAIADRRLAPAAQRTAAAATITSASTKKTPIQTKLSIMTIGLRITSQFGSQATTMNNGITPVVRSNVCSALTFHATKKVRTMTAAAGTSAFQIGNPLQSPQ